MVEERIVYIINGGKYGNGYISISKSEYDGNWQEGSASCGLQNKSIADIKREYSGKTKFIIIKLPSLPKQQMRKGLTI